MDETNRQDPQDESAANESSQGRTPGLEEEFKVSGDRVLSTIKELIREGNVRRIIIKNEEGRTLLEIPLTVGVVGTVLLPVWAAVGAVAALVANMTIAVERRAPAQPAAPAAGSEVAPASTDE